MFSIHLGGAVVQALLSTSATKKQVCQPHCKQSHSCVWDAQHAGCLDRLGEIGISGLQQQRTDQDITHPD